MKKHFAISIGVTRVVNHECEFYHSAGAVHVKPLPSDAESRTEAVRIGMILAKEKYPEKDGWENHNVATCSIELTNELLLLVLRFTSAMRRVFGLLR
jgi:hypothetical protein